MMIIYFGSNYAGGTIYAYKGNDEGRLKWSTSNYFFTGNDRPITVDGQAIYFVNSKQKIYSLGAKSGNLRWKRGMATGEYITADPVVNEGVLYFATNLRVHARNTTDGGLKWSSMMTNVKEVSIGKNYVYVTNGLNNIQTTALNMKTGKAVWTSVGTDNPYGFSISNLDGLAFLSYSSGVIAIDLISGKQKWNKGIYDDIYRSAVGTGDYIYVLGNQSIHAIRKSDGHEKWQISPDDGNDNFEDVIVSNDGHVYANTKTTIYLINTDNGDTTELDFLESLVKYDNYAISYYESIFLGGDHALYYKFYGYYEESEYGGVVKIHD